MTKIKYTKEIIEPIVNKNINIKGVIEDVGMVYSNGSVSCINKIIKKYNIDTSHFLKGKVGSIRIIKNNNNLFIKNSKDPNQIIRNRILKFNLIEYKCNECGCDDKWRNKKLILILDHINGINNDHRLENLRFLCPNCDSIQDTYKGRNKNNENGKLRLKNKIFKQNKIFELKELKRKKNDNIIQQIKNSNINFNKQGWRLEIGKLLNWSPQWVGKYIKNNIPEIWEICWKHKSY